MDKPVAIVLGGTVPHISLVKKLKHRGYLVYLIDYLANPPAKEFADEHIKESTLDKEAVLKIAEGKKASIVISTCVDQANAVCCYVAEKLKLPHPYSYATALEVTDKVIMKDVMLKNKIPTARHIHVKSVEEALESCLKYPLIVKPADSNSANGVKRVLNDKDLRKHLPVALHYSRNGYAIVEEFVSGVEISAYCIISNGKAKLLMAQERISVIDGKSETIKCYSSYAPARISPEAMSKIESIATEISTAFNLNNTPLFFQGIVKDDDIWIIEFAPRVGGGISSYTINVSTGFDIIEAAIDSFLGNPIDISNWHPMTKHYAVNQIYGTNGIYGGTMGYNDLTADGTIENISFYKKPGDSIDETRASSSRIGVMVFCGDNENEVRSKIQTAFSRIDSYDNSGKSIMRRDLNLDNLWNK